MQHSPYLGGVAQDEADRTSERIKFTFAEKRERGESTNGRAPLGYKIINNRPVIDEETAEAAKDVYRTYIRTRSVAATVRHLRETRGIDRAYKNIKQYLEHPIYKGEFLGMDAPAIVSKEEWDLVQEIMKRRACRNEKLGNIFLFSGIVRCEDCGASMSGERIVKGSYEYVYYRCSKKSRGGNCSNGKRINETVLEQWLLRNLLDIAKEYNASIEPIATAKKKQADRVERIRAKMEKLKDLYLSDLIEKDIYTKDYTALKAELEKEETFQAEKKNPIDLTQLKTALSVYQSLTRQGKKEFWSWTIKKIIATQSGDFFVELI